MNETTKKIALWTAGGLLVLLGIFTLFGGGMYGNGSMMYGNGPGGMMGAGFGSWWMLVPVLFWGGLLALIVWAIVRISSPERPADGEPPRDPAEETLRQRFARGELDAEEYERFLKTLRDGGARNDRDPAPR